MRGVFVVACMLPLMLFCFALAKVTCGLSSLIAETTNKASNKKVARDIRLAILKEAIINLCRCVSVYVWTQKLSVKMRDGCGLFSVDYVRAARERTHNNM